MEGQVVEWELASEGSDREYRLVLRPEITEFTPSPELSLQGLDADEIGRLRARRILLNENPAPVESLDMNVVTKEIHIRGLGTRLQVHMSPFPALWLQFGGGDPRRFLEIAWIQAVAVLVLTGSVAQVAHLALTLEEGALAIDFTGRRRRRFANAPPAEVIVTGRCRLE